MNTSTEAWLPVPGYEGHYEVSDRGRVRSLKRDQPQLLKQYANANMTLMVSLWREGVRTCSSVHRIVAEAFLPRPTEGLLAAYHISSDVQDNRPSNLVWKPVKR